MPVDARCAAFGRPSPEYALAELLDAAFPDIEDVFSVEELLKLWSEFEDGA